ncbi:MAG: hypothetical protein ABJF23_08675 [Bryobacteraceae bacterium]
MAKAFIETTILANILLKPGDIACRNKAALAKYETSSMPTYAIKELKAGALAYYVWTYNKLVVTDSLANTLLAIRSVMSFQPYRASTAIEALASAMQPLIVSSELQTQYGKIADPQQVIFDSCRLMLKKLIIGAWKRRRLICDSVLFPIGCFRESGPKEVDGLFELEERRCKPQTECELGLLLKKDPKALVRLKGVVDTQPQKRENSRRSKALRELIRNPKRPCTETMCRDLGDVIFAFLAPIDATVLTTNLRDIQPLVAALGKKASSPD